MGSYDVTTALYQRMRTRRRVRQMDGELERLERQIQKCRHDGRKRDTELRHGLIKPTQELADYRHDLLSHAMREEVFLAVLQRVQDGELPPTQATAEAEQALKRAREDRPYLEALQEKLQAEYQAREAEKLAKAAARKAAEHAARPAINPPVPAPVKSSFLTRLFGTTA